MKRLQIRKPFVLVLEKMGLDISCVPKNMIDRYTRKIKSLHDEAQTGWIKARLYRTFSLDDLSQDFINGVVYPFAIKLIKEYEQDVLAVA